MTRFLVTQIGFNAVWCACVFGAIWGVPWLGVGAALVWIAFHLMRQAVPQGEWVLVLSAGLVGAIADLVLIRVGGLSYTGLATEAAFGPLWIVALWMAFATSINVSLHWLRGRPILGALVGAGGGILAYRGGLALGVVSYAPDDPQSLLALAVVWGIAIPLLVRLGGICDRIKPDTWPSWQFDRRRAWGVLPSLARMLR